MELALRRPGAEELDVRSGGNDGNAVLYHPGEPRRHVTFVARFGLGRGTTHDPRQPVPLDELCVELQSAALEGHGPEAAGKQAQAVGVVIGRLVDGDDDFPRLQQLRIGAGPAVGPPEEGVVLLVKSEPMVGAGLDVLQMPPARREVPDEFQRRHAEKGRVENA